MNIDDALSAIAGSPVPEGLETLAGGVFAQVEADSRSNRQARAGVVIAMCAATIAGTASAAIPAARPAAAAPAMVSAAFAPSTLLGGGE